MNEIEKFLVLKHLNKKTIMAFDTAGPKKYIQIPSWWCIFKCLESLLLKDIVFKPKVKKKQKRNIHS